MSLQRLHALSGSRLPSFNIVRFLGSSQQRINDSSVKRHSIIELPIPARDPLPKYIKRLVPLCKPYVDLSP